MRAVDGSSLLVVENALGRIGGLACWEHVMNLARAGLIEMASKSMLRCGPRFPRGGFDQVAKRPQIEAILTATMLSVGKPL